MVFSEPRFRWIGDRYPRNPNRRPAVGREARCWFRKIANCLAALPKSTDPGAKETLAETWNAEDWTHALAAAA